MNKNKVLLLALLLAGVSQSAHARFRFSWSWGANFNFMAPFGLPMSVQVHAPVRRMRRAPVCPVVQPVVYGVPVAPVYYHPRPVRRFSRPRFYGMRPWGHFGLSFF